MTEYIEREKVLKCFEELKNKADSFRDKVYLDGVMAVIEALPAADVAPVVHETPMLRSYPKRYEKYQEYGLNENGDMLYLKQVFIDEKNWVMYCPRCGKRLCSRFISFCPKCGAKMDEKII